MKRKVLLITIHLLMGFGFLVQAQSPPPEPLPVRFVNTGKMAVASNGTSGTSLFIPYSVLMTDADDSNKSNVCIYQQGATVLYGNFYQDSKSNVFKVDTDGWGTSTGKVIFSNDNASKNRVIQTRKESDMENFERKDYYVAFPHIVIDTDDVIKLHSKMGIDAASVHHRKSSNEGMLYLCSDPDKTGKKVFDASLRITGVGITNPADRTSEKLIDAGIAIIERELSIYRSHTNPLFPFAAPMTNLRAGYYAGNFVRQFIEDDDYAGHVEHVLANNDSDGNGLIDTEHYLTEADDYFTTGKAYLIKPRPPGHDYSEHLFNQTGGAGKNIYDQGKFIFNGTVWDLENKHIKQVYSEERLFFKDLNNESFDKTVNLMIGNSYTSALSMDKIIAEMGSTGLMMSPIIYVYPAGSTSYIPHDVTSSTNIIEHLDDIPSMTYLMVRLTRDELQNGQFEINRRFQTHGRSAHGFLRSDNSYNNELVFRVSPEDNDNVYDLAMIALRSGSTGSINKVTNPQKDAFQLYASNKRSVAIEAENTEKVSLGFVPSSEMSSYRIAISRAESMNTKELWLEDLKTGVWTDLRNTQNYSFESEKGDLEERFLVHFVKKSPTGIDAIVNSPLNVFYNEGEIVIYELVESDLNAVVSVFDTQGRSIAQGMVRNHPEERLSADLQTGVYLVHIGGERNSTVKILVKRK
jgi:hypothetical protein